MRYNFYDSIEYKRKQSYSTKQAWSKGIYSNKIAKLEKRKCKVDKCQNFFTVKSYDPKLFCSKSCSAKLNNSIRIRVPLTIETKLKISLALTGIKNKFKGKILIPRLIKHCLLCGKIFETERWQNKKYCSNYCSIRDTGSKRTSPKAARGKSGIRLDINPQICFYSRWEANFARILNYLGIRWEFQYKTFQLNKQKYTPDFYLPYTNEYVEIKNFMSEYSKNRDEEFRKLYPDVKLRVVLKEEYLGLQNKFSVLIKNWEFS